VKIFLFDQSFGSIAMMRVELESKFNAERVFVKAEDGVDLDCIWIPAFGKSGENTYPTMLI